MASGTFERPLPDPSSEKSLLGLGGLSLSNYSLAANQTRYLVFKDQIKFGYLATFGYNANAGTKSGLYQLCCTSSGNDPITLTAVKAVSYSGLAITPISSKVVQITNPSGSGYLWVSVMLCYGDAPTLQSTLPT